MSAQPWIKSYPKGVRPDVPLDISSLQSVLETAAARFGDKPALQFMDKRMSYAELDALANRAAAGFQKLGVKPGVHVGLYLPNTPHYVIAFFGVLKAGGTVVNYSPLDALPALEFKVRNSETDILVTREPRLDLSSGREAPRDHAAEGGGHRRVRRIRDRAGRGQGAHDLGGHAVGGEARCAPHRLPRPPRQRRALRIPSCRRSGGRGGRARLYRRHDRLAQRRDADPREPDGGLLALSGGALPERGKHATRGRRAFPLHLADVPHLLARRCHAARFQHGRGARPPSPVRSGGRRSRHRAQEDHRLHGRADDACRDPQPARHRSHGFLVASLMRVGRSAPPGCGQGAVGQRRGLPDLRGLGNDGDVADRHVHAARRPVQARLLRDPLPRHAHETRRRRRPRPAKSLRASAAKSASKARTS